MSKTASVYWIRLKHHNDPYKDGYVGVSKNVHRRMCEHKSKKENPILENVFNKHKNVIVDILFEGDYENCFGVEKEYRPHKEIGWNINEGGIKPPDATGIKRSEKTKKLISENNVGFKGRKHSLETKLKMSLSHKKISGKPHTEETKKKLSEIAKNRTTHTLKIKELS
jgi:beta-glucosidase/6-phospho-beta-glucosidase/beta-galactosidase